MSTDGSNVKAEMTVKVLAPVFTWYLEERRSFEFDYEPGLIKYPLNADGAYGNDWNLLIDEGSVWQASFISMSKPGRAMAPGATVGDIFIPVDMKQTLKFNQISSGTAPQTHLHACEYGNSTCWEVITVRTSTRWKRV